MNRLQRNWDLRAALNFMFGGAGSALVLFSTFTSGKHELILGMALVAAGLGAVWLEIGRKLRALHVFFNPFTSWMTRESFAAVLVFGFGISFLLSGGELSRALCGISGACFLYCQARILHAAKGIPAWRVPEVVPFVVCTGLAEGLGLALLFGAQPLALLLFAAALVARVIAWRRYRAAFGNPALDGADAILVNVGTALALVLAAVAPSVPPAAPLAGLAALAAGWRCKRDLVTRAAFKQEFTLPRLPVRGTR